MGICSDSKALGISGNFQSASGERLSRAFHAAKGRTVNVDVSASFASSGSNPNLGTFGVELFQCCSISDSKLVSQIISEIGSPSSPAHVTFEHTLSDKCTLSTQVGSDFVYYLRIFVAHPDPVDLSYSVG
ncbi:hypothetical protein [Streptomyces decoyicus]|uniref:hypothetical protein n=1 Tax=Streptomyces decoyicus TaxID=249567 RepID=UPI002E1805EC|nr:hypothetical protein OG532_00790 [Streptomyces decoyicus]